MGAFSHWWIFGREARRRRLLRRRAIPAAEWSAVLDAAPVLWPLSADERRRLHDLVVVFLAEREFEGCGGVVLDDRLRRLIAAQACLLVLELDLDAFRNVGSVLVYPRGYRTRRHHEDEFGIVSEGDDELLGEAWNDGPVILNVEDVLDVAEGEPFNLVLHEFAHKLDMLDGDEDGVPPLPRGLDADTWRRDFAAAREDLARRERRGEEPPIDPYAAEDEAEGFAVLTETFFCAPWLLEAEYPRVYAQLRAFYRQDPLARDDALAEIGSRP
ncbi:MAG: zinc-dependent peptidase [Planctomycetes bacterium]|nr:zinc-dependent peptidase [Planctomycetota bacterium]